MKRSPGGIILACEVCRGCACVSECVCMNVCARACSLGALALSLIAIPLGKKVNLGQVT